MTVGAGVTWRSSKKQALFTFSIRYCTDIPNKSEEETSFHILCACEALASLRRAHLGSIFLDSDDIKKLSIGVIWNFGKGTGLLYPSDRLRGTKGLF
jgi:hypothetical protein